MRWPLLSSLLLASGCSPALEVRQETYPRSGRMRYQGIVEHSHTGRLAKREWIFWYPSGRMQARGSFRDGSPVEPSDLKASGTRVPTEGRDGRWTFWSPEGQILSTGTYVRGRREGLWSCWHENGQLCARGTFQEGLEEGLHMRWHENGAVSERRRYLRGVPNGPAKRWDPSGVESGSGENVEGSAVPPLDGPARSASSASEDPWDACLRREPALDQALAAR